MDNAIELSKLPCIFIHGIKGSSIVDEAGGVYFLNIWQGLGLSSPTLALPLEWEGDVQKRDQLKAGNVLESIAGTKIYGKFMGHMRSTGRPFYPYAYDWRRDLNETAANFQEFIRQTCAAHPGKKVQIIAHSMGGLVTLGAINGAIMSPGTSRLSLDLIHSVLFAGVPFHTGINFLNDLQLGTANGYNRRILSPEVLFTFPSLYNFFPPPENPEVFDELGQPILIDFYNAQEWINYDLGIFNKREPTPQELVHLERCVRQAKFFREKITCLPGIKYPPIAVLASHVHPTMHHLLRKTDGTYDFHALAPGMGDDRLINATPPQGIPFTEYETQQPHAGLLNDIDQVNISLLALHTSTKTSATL